MSVQSLVIKINKNTYICMYKHRHTHQTWHGPGNQSSNTLAYHEFSGPNQMFKSKWQQILPSHQLIEIIQGIVMEGFFTKSNKVLLRAKDPILISWIVAIAFLWRHVYVPVLHISETKVSLSFLCFCPGLFSPQFFLIKRFSSHI